MVQPVRCKVCGVAHFGAAHVWPKDQDDPALTPIQALGHHGPKARDRVLKPKVTPSTLDAYLAEQKAAKAAYMKAYRARKR
jgi:hypothetical protein